MLGKILVPLDGSGFAARALEPAVKLAARDGAVLELLTVVPPPVPPVYLEGAGAVAGELYDQVAESATEYLEGVRNRLVEENPGLAVEAFTVRGPVVETIHQSARERGPDLIVMSSHGRGPLARMWLGSVADGVLRSAPVPLLLIRPVEGRSVVGEDPLPYPTVLIPIDGSGTTLEVLDDAVEVAGSGARYHLFRVFTPSASGLGIRGHLPDPLDTPVDPEAELARAEERLETAAESLRGRGVREVTTELVTATHAASEIIEHAERERYSLVAMSTHGEGGVSRMLLGSTADKVARALECPVLLHRRPGSAAA